MRHAGTAVYVHVVWATWDRQPLMVGEVERRVQRAIGAKCEELGAKMVALGGMEDHVHLLVRLPAAVSLATLVGQVKGASAHLVTHEVMRDGEFFKWQGAYGAVSVSPRHLPIVANYIIHQRKHHTAGSLMEGLELPPMPVLRASAATLGDDAGADGPQGASDAGASGAGASGAGASGAGASGAGASGAGVSGAGVSGAGVSGAGASGAGVSGAGASGAGASGAGVSGAGA